MHNEIHNLQLFLGLSCVYIFPGVGSAVVQVSDFLFKTMNFALQTMDFSLQNDGFCVKNDEFRKEHDDDAAEWKTKYGQMLSALYIHAGD